MISETITVTIDDGRQFQGALAVVESTSLGFEDHGILTAFLYCAGEGWGQGAGGYALSGVGMAIFVQGVLECLGLPTWESIVRTQIMVLRDGTPAGPIVGIKRIVGGRPLIFADAMAMAGSAS